MDVIPEHRPPRKWMILILAWVIGMAVFTVYLGMIFVLIYRWFG